MLTLSRVFARFTPAGRREARARKWDQIADRAAQRKKLYGLVVAVSTLTAVPVGKVTEARTWQLEAAKDELKARNIATQIRRGER